MAGLLPKSVEAGGKHVIVVTRQVKPRSMESDSLELNRRVDPSRVFVWGANKDGQLGVNDTEDVTQLNPKHTMGE